MKNLRILLLLTTLSACGSGEQAGPTDGTGTGTAGPDGNTHPAASGASAAAQSSGDNIVPARDDATQFARRFAAVSELVGEEAAKRVMVSADTQATPLYQLDLPNGNSVQWYEVLAGIPVAVEFGSSASGLTPDLKLRKLSATELFVALAPGVAPPAELVELDQRQREMAPIYRRLTAAAARYTDVALTPIESTLGEPARNALPPSAQSSEQGVAQQKLALTAEQCLSKSFACGAFPLSMAWRIEQRDRTADCTISRSDVLSVFGVGCCQTGQITYRVRYRTWFSWTTWFAYDMAAGQWVEPWYLPSDLLDFDFEGRLYNFQAGDKGSQCAAGPS
jgi:hypothetical protein